MHMLFGRRRRLQALNEREAAGEDLWTDKLDERARFRILYLVHKVVDGTDSRRYNLVAEARRLVLEDLGLPFLYAEGARQQDVEHCILEGEEETVFSYLEALVRLGSIVASQYFGNVPTDDTDRYRSRIPDFIEAINVVLEEHRCSYELVEGTFVPMESRTLHRSVVVPALRLLGGRSDFEASERSFRKAIEELQGGDPQDAITDASTALQEALGALGCQGNTVSRRLKDAIAKGYLTPYDSKLAEWLEADRSLKGDAHNADDADRTDAWLVVHIVGALVLRVASGPPRR